MKVVDAQGNRFRRAMVTQKCQLEEVKAHLPVGYRAYRNFDNTIMIEGWDRADWTMDGYIIPTLASGLIVAQEVEV